jgi:hypothetical protein
LIRPYRDRFVKLVPPAIQPNVSATLDDAAEALKRWLAGQIIAMIVVGALTGFGLLLGFPLAVVLDIVIRRLYVRDTLGERVRILGKPRARATVRHPSTAHRDRELVRRRMLG